MAETEQRPAEPDHLEAGERAYFESRGEKDIPASPPADAPKPSADVAPVPADASKPDAPKPPEPSATVPQQALHDERKRRQEAEERARQMELLNARMEERFRAFHAATQQRPAPVPTPDQDIFGAVKHMQAEQQRTRAEIDGYKRQIQQEDYAKQLTNWGRNAEAELLSQNSDY